MSAVPSGMIISLRYLINDVDSPYTYSDNRLATTLTVAAQFVDSDVPLANDYTMDVANATITPDPSTLDPADTDFMNLTVLRAACFIDQGTLRTRAALNGIVATLGPATFNAGGSMEGFLEIINNGPCAMYDELSWQYACGNTAILRAVLSPFIHNQFDPSYFFSYPPRRECE